jgi:hypothetical protein
VSPLVPAWSPRPRISGLSVPIVGDRTVGDGAFDFDLQAVHFPDLDLPAVVTP